MLKRIIICAILCCGYMYVSIADTVFVSTTGNDANSGATRQEALRHFTPAVAKLNAGDVMMILSGIYVDSILLAASKSGTDSLHPITITGTHRDSVIIDGENRLKYLLRSEGADYIHLMNLTFRRAAVHQYLMWSNQAAVLTTSTSDSAYGWRISDIMVDSCGGMGLGVRLCHDCELRRCIAQRNSFAGFNGGYTRNLRVIDCIARYNNLGWTENPFPDSLCHMEYDDTRQVWYFGYPSCSFHGDCGMISSTASNTAAFPAAHGAISLRFNAASGKMRLEGIYPDLMNRTCISIFDVRGRALVRIGGTADSHDRTFAGNRLSRGVYIVNVHSPELGLRACQ